MGPLRRAQGRLWAAFLRRCAAQRSASEIRLGNLRG